MSMSTMVSFTQGLGPLALAPMFPQLIEAFNSDLVGVVQFVGVCILVLGFSNFIWYASWGGLSHPNVSSRNALC